jgi:hypothetical protein
MALINTKPITPIVRLPDANVADSGKVRLGDGAITGVVPAPRLPNASMTGYGK